MAFQLPIDCLIKILECLEDDKVTLYSCLLVNRLWCRISVEILWSFYNGIYDETYIPNILITEEILKMFMKQTPSLKRNADFKELQHITFPHLQILKLVNCPVEVNMLINFLENNGKSLKELYVNECNNSLNLAIAEFCPNLKSLYTKFPKNGTEILEAIFKNCQQLNSIKTICDDSYIGGKIILEIVVKYSPKNFRELKLLILSSHEKLSSEDLQLFFTGWEARIPQNPISLIISYDNSFEIDINIDEIITKYKKIIKKFKIKKKYFLIYSF
ncbi:hypothetical protein RhiirA4_446649 [Rhizophagus irregularis]|uniref:F-box domain-containing protein n=1 Tax=Rhizophagus irregularis TaxID=588596 RepID=A0A2I1GWM3_9GLOM|nr:hypothetical protein RhiirA4_446649 [Rhizophagus irregularis]